MVLTGKARTHGAQCDRIVFTSAKPWLGNKQAGRVRRRSLVRHGRGYKQTPIGCLRRDARRALPSPFCPSLPTVRAPRRRHYRWLREFRLQHQPVRAAVAHEPAVGGAADGAQAQLMGYRMAHLCHAAA